MINFIPIDECKNWYLYKVRARNFRLGIYVKQNLDYQDEKNYFIGIRNKFNFEYLDREFHYDTGAPYGTCKPLELLEEVPSNIVSGSKEEMFKYLKEKYEEYD